MKLAAKHHKCPAIIIDLKVDGDKVSSTVNEIGNGDPLTSESGRFPEK